MTVPAEGHRENPVWRYEDLVLFLGAMLPCFTAALLLVHRVRFPSDGVQTMTLQFVFYVLLLGALYALIAGRYRQPFWRSLAWTIPSRGAWLCILAGPCLAIALAALSAVLRAPEEPVIQNLMTDRISLIAVVVFGSLLAPIFEELVFRGFIFPLLARSLGAWPGILLTALAFALLHGSQFHWSWQSILIIGMAGIAFGMARYKTGSTAAATAVHVGYNSTLFAVFLVQRGV
jgi:membrane protease YdiL (CAAX protease family)